MLQEPGGQQALHPGERPPIEFMKLCAARGASKTSDVCKLAGALRDGELLLGSQLTQGGNFTDVELTRRRIEEGATGPRCAHCAPRHFGDLTPRIDQLFARE